MDKQLISIVRDSDPHRFVDAIDKLILEGYKVSSTSISQHQSILRGQQSETIYDAILIKDKQEDQKR